MYTATTASYTYLHTLSLPGALPICGTGGKFGVGQRMPIKATRALLNAALDGSLNAAQFRKDPVFGFEVPVSVPGVDASILDPRSTWSNKDEYDRTAQQLAQLFIDNFAEFEKIGRAHV